MQANSRSRKDEKKKLSHVLKLLSIGLIRSRSRPVAIVMLVVGDEVVMDRPPGRV